MDFYKRRYQNRQIAILGFGREGQSSYKFLRRVGYDKKITLFDENLAHLEAWQQSQSDSALEIRRFDQTALEQLQQFDLIFRTPGLSRTKIKGLDQTKITSQTNEFLLSQAGRTIAVTGTKGKSTTSTLLAEVLRDLGQRVQLLGNLGQPALDMLSFAEEPDWYVYEMSSYQLENITVAPKIGVLLNLFEEHLDHYDDFDDYGRAKLRLLSFPEQSLAIYGSDNALLKSKRKLFQAQDIQAFGLLTNRPEQEAGIYLDGETIVKIDRTGATKHLAKADFKRYLKGQHNLINSLAVLLVVEEIVGLDAKNLDRVLMTIGRFKGLEHRLEFVGQFKGIDFYNDSISTIPQATMAAVLAIDNLQTLIIGGFDRGVRQAELIDFLNQRPDVQLICLPKTGHDIYDSLDQTKYRVNDLSAAVSLAYQITESGRACLLSPAAASYTFFRDFEDRGRQFKQMVQTLGNQV